MAFGLHYFLSECCVIIQNSLLLQLGADVCTQFWRLFSFRFYAITFKHPNIAATLTRLPEAKECEQYRFLIEISLYYYFRRYEICTYWQVMKILDVSIRQRAVYLA
jgi:hypothetical protein